MVLSAMAAWSLAVPLAVGGVGLLLGLVLGFVLVHVRTRWCRTCGEDLSCAACEKRRGAMTRSTGRLGLR
jgi:hypothetical protein